MSSEAASRTSCSEVASALAGQVVRRANTAGRWLIRDGLIMSAIAQGGGRALEGRLGEGADPIESIEWLRGFGERYIGAWNVHHRQRSRHVPPKMSSETTPGWPSRLAGVRS